MTARIRIALIGCGRMGQRWLRVLRESPRFDLAVVVDPAAPSGALRSIEMAPPFDAAIVATPTPTHYEVAHGLLMASVSVLVEKPLAANYNDARALVDLAAAKGARLAVGHVERFNPAVRALFDVVRSGAIGSLLRLGATRRGPRPASAPEATLDLAVHDLDLLRALVGPLHVDACFDDDPEDDVAVALESDDAVPMTVRASWSEDRYRLMWALGTKGVASADLLARTLTVTGKTSPVEQRDPLTDQLAAFARLIDGEDATPLCSGEDGAAAVLLAERAMRGETGGSFV